MRRSGPGWLARIGAPCLLLLALMAPCAVMARDPTPAEQAVALQAVPKDRLPYYQGYWYVSDIITNPLKNWHPHPPPWQICHNDSYLGNSWRAHLVEELKLIAHQLAQQGLAKDRVIVTNSNGDINLELSQLKAEIAQGCDVIMSYPGSPTGLCSGVHDAFEKGVLFVAIDAAVRCPEAINVASSPYYRGKVEGQWIAQTLHGKGNVIAMNGQPGTSSTIALRQGLAAGIAGDPGIHVIGDLYGMWTGSVAKSEMLKFLATHPQRVDAVWSTGQMAVASGQALQQSGRSLPLITDATNMCSFLAFWAQNHLTSMTYVQDGGPLAYTAFIPVLHILAGEKPKLNTLFLPLLVVNNANLAQYYRPSMTIQSTCFANGSDLHMVPDNYFDAYFTGSGKLAKLQIEPTP